MAAAAGLLLVPVEKRNPLHTTTYGLGEMLTEMLQMQIPALRQPRFPPVPDSLFYISASPTAHTFPSTHTTTYGLGEMLKDAVRHGIRRFLVGIGGSATNDGGAGMLQALGFDLLDKEGRQIPLGAKGLKDLVLIDDRTMPAPGSNAPSRNASNANPSPPAAPVPARSGFASV